MNLIACCVMAAIRPRLLSAHVIYASLVEYLHL